MKSRLQLKPKNKVRVSTSVKLIIGGAVFATLVAFGFLLYYNFGASGDIWAVGDSRFSGYNWRKKISFERAIIQGDTPLLNFPLLIEIKDPDLRHISRGGKMIHLKGSDIRFSKADGESALISQIERYNPETGELLAWVLLDTLSPKSANTLYLYFSRADLPGTGSDLFWENEYQAVWHFGIGLHGDNSRRIKATTMGTSECKGKIGNGRSFNAQNADCAYFPWLQDLDLKEDISISGWVNLNSSGREQVILSNQGDQPGGYRLFVDKNNKIGFDFINGAGVRMGSANTSGGNTLATGEWYYVAAVYTLDDKTIRTYINGKLDRTCITTDSPAPTPSSLQMGRDQFDVQSYFDGMLDELRITKRPKSAAWLASEYYNQKLAGSLFQVGPAEELLMQVADLKANKNAMGKLYGTELEMKEVTNQLQAKKAADTGNKPAPVSENADVIKARLENIRRVSQQNSKSK